MRAIQTADSVQVIGDENGWELHVDTDEGDRFVFKIHHLAESFAHNVYETIGEWLREAEDARATYRPPVTEGDLAAYALIDPKRVALEQENGR